MDDVGNGNFSLAGRTDVKIGIRALVQCHKGRSEGEIHCGADKECLDKAVKQSVLCGGEQTRAHQRVHACTEDFHHVGDPDADHTPDQKSCPHVGGQSPLLFGKADGKQLACRCKNRKLDKAHDVGVSGGKGLEYLTRGGDDQNGRKGAECEHNVANDQDLFPYGRGCIFHLTPPRSDSLRQRRAG